MAINNLNYIGLNDKLPWKCSEDLKHFKKLTSYQRLIVGYNTAQNLPKLENRTIIVDTKPHPAFPFAQLTNGLDWCIGGAKTYEKYCHLFTELHISHINDNTIGDIVAPELKNLNEKCKIFRYFFEPDR